MTEKARSLDDEDAVDGEPRSVSIEPRPDLPAPMSMRRRAAIFVLLLGGVLAARPLIEATPDERRFSISVDAPVERIELVWRDEEGDVIRQLEQNVPASGPAVVERVLRLRAGRYQLEMTTHGKQGPAHAIRTIDIAEDTSEVRVVAPTTAAVRSSQ